MAPIRQEIFKLEYDGYRLVTPYKRHLGYGCIF